MKPIKFLGDSLNSIRQFPSDVRRETGYQLDRVQSGKLPDDWKPMNSIGLGVNEIRLRNKDGAFRVIYIAKLEDAVYVLHAFEKKSQRTSKTDIELARKRLGELRRQT